MTLLRFLSLLLVLVCVGCDRPVTPPPVPPQAEQAAQAVNQFAQNPSPDQKAQTDAAFAQLDQEIDSAQQRVDQSSGSAKAENQAQLDSLKARRDQLRHEYNKAKFDQLQADTNGLLDRIGNSVDHAAQTTGDTAKGVGDTVAAPFPSNDKNNESN